LRDNYSSNSKSHAYPSFIETYPEGTDLFEGKSHQQIAEQIAEIIRLNNSPSKLLGIDGPWGSGKSNLIKIIEFQLLCTHHFFYYAAWGHQEDLQRRSFLEELTENLCSTNDVDKACWQAKLTSLLSRKRTIKTKTIPRVSHGILLTGLIVVLTPIMQSIGTTIPNAWLNVLITASPSILGILVYVIASFREKRFLPLSDIFKLYKEHELSKEKELTISESEPSVREFQTWMEDLSESLTEKNW